MKIIIGFGIILLNIFQGFSQETTVTDYPMSESSLLWEISGPNVQPSYLFGTMHLIEKDYFYFPKKLEKFVKKSDVLVMELAGMPDEAEAMSYVILPEGSFFDFFTEEQTDTILGWAKDKFKMDESTFRLAFSKMKPFVVIQLAIQMHFIGKTESYELTFETLAQENGIPIEGLETIADQMGIFDNLSSEQQVEMVMEGIREGDKSIKVIREMQEMYNSQEIDSLYMFVTNEEADVIAEEQSKFLDDRNTNWVPKIVKLIVDKKTFIAVGAGHLGGPNGVIRLLEKEGYTLTPIQL